MIPITSNREEITPPARAAALQADVDWSLWHFFILLIAGIGTALFAGYALANFNATPTVTSTTVAAAAFSALLLVTLFQTFLLKSFTLHLWVCIAEAAGLLFFFFSDLNPWILFGIVLFILYQLWAFGQGRRDLGDHLTIQFSRFSRLTLSVTCIGLALFLSLLYAGLYHEHGLSPRGFSLITSGSAPIISHFVPGFSADMPADTFFYQFAKGQLGGDAQVQSLSESDRELVYRQSGKKVQDELSQSAEVAARPNESVTDYFYRVSIHYLNAADNPKLGLAAILVIILLAYSTIRFMLFFVKWIVAAVGALIYRLLLTTKVIYITTEPRTKEIINVK